MQLAEAATEHTASEKRAFVPMPGGEGAPPPMDPAMMGMDPAMMGGGGMPMDPAAMGGMPMDPMAMAAGGEDPAAIMAAQGAPVDPMMAAAGGAAGVAPPPEAAPAEAAPAKGGGQKEKLDEIHSMLTKVMGVLVGKGLLGAEELGNMMGVQGQESGVPAEQKVASQEPETVGSVVEDTSEDIPLPVKAASEVKNALAGLILALGGNK